MDEQTEELVKNLVTSISIISMLALGYLMGLMKAPGIVLGLAGGLLAIDLWHGISLWKERRDHPIFTMIIHMEE